MLRELHRKQSIEVNSGPRSILLLWSLEHLFSIMNGNVGCTHLPMLIQYAPPLATVGTILNCHVVQFSQIPNVGYGAECRWVDAELNAWVDLYLKERKKSSSVHQLFVIAEFVSVNLNCNNLYHNAEHLSWLQSLTLNRIKLLSESKFCCLFPPEQ